MSRKIGRGALAALAAGAMALTLGSTAHAADDPSINPDSLTGVSVELAGSANLYRIADADRISTAIKASKSRSWGEAPTYGDHVNRWDCGTFTNAAAHGRLAPKDLAAGETAQFPHVTTVNGWPALVEITCTVKRTTSTNAGSVEIIISRDNNFSDALAATTLADVADAPILLNPTGDLDPRVAAEITRLANATRNSADEVGNVRVHLLGGVDALSARVHDKINALPGVSSVVRHQGIDRYETAVRLASSTLGHPGFLGAGVNPIRDINAYLTTGLDFADALSAGAAAAENNGVVLLTAGADLDRRGFTENFLINLRDYVNEAGWTGTTTKNYAVGGPSARAAADYDIRLADSYVGADRYETAVLTAEATFSNPSWYAVASGETYPDALVAGGWIANADGPLLLTRTQNLSPVTGAYLTDTVTNGDSVVVFGGGNSVTPQVSTQVGAALKAAFPVW